MKDDVALQADNLTQKVRELLEKYGQPNGGAWRLVRVLSEVDEAGGAATLAPGWSWPQAELPESFWPLLPWRCERRFVELKRIVLQPKDLGYGRACVRLLAEMAFRDLGAHRFWLDVKALNVRAQALYRSEGFVEEGRLRESVRTEDVFDSLIVMSMLDREHAQRRIT